MEIAVQDGKVLVLKVHGNEFDDALSEAVDFELLSLDDFEVYFRLNAACNFLPLFRTSDGI